ncbi:MAG TPA: prepilin-type N-terminal cleavage/methylation domain-containing protein [Methylomirabilota bacterium]|nr:prepilin-type N-terminal cleavage/methylation domain-containing protein [Methylomirabilota bacterium]
MEIRDERGFSLSELLVSVAVIGLVMAGIATLLSSGSQTYLAGANQIETQQAARATLQRMAQEIQAAGYDPQGLGGAAPLGCPWFPIVGPSPGFGAPTATSLTVQSDNNGDGCITAPERIWYTLAGTTLQRQDFAVDVAPLTILGGVQALTFTYLDQDGNPAAAPAAIRSVDIQLTVQPELLAATWQTGRVAVTVRDRIRVRNR